MCYHELLPVHEEENVVTLGEEFPPLEKLPFLGTEYGLNNLYMKSEEDNSNRFF